MRMPALVLTCLLILANAAFAAAGNTYHSDEHGYSIKFPEGWEMTEENPDVDVRAMSREGFNLNINTFVIGAELDEDLIMELPDVAVTAMKRDFPDIRLLQKRETTLDGVKAVRFAVTFTGDGDLLKMTIVSALYDGKLYQLACGSEEKRHAEANSLCRASIESFRFNDAKAASVIMGRNYHSEEHGYSITFPEGWEISTDVESAEVQAVSDKGNNMNITVASVEKDLMGISLDEIPALTLETIKANMSDVRKIDAGTTLLDGEKAFWLVVSYAQELDSGRFRFRTTLFQGARGDKFFQLTCLAAEEQYSDVSPLCWEAFESVRFDRPESFTKAAHSTKERTYHSDEHGYSVTFPEGWTIEHSELGADVMSVAPDGDNIIIRTSDYDEKPFDMLSDDETDDMHMNMLNIYRMNYSDVKLTRIGTSSLGGEKALWVIAKYPDGWKKLQTLMLLAVHDGTLVSITCMAMQKDFDRVEPLCWEAVESFKFDRPVHSTKVRPSAEGNTYHSEEHGYSITFPEGWEVNEESGNPVAKSLNREMIGMHVSTVSDEDADNLSKKGALMEKSIKKLKKRAPDLEVLRKGEVGLGGEDAEFYVVTYSGETSQYKFLRIELLRGEKNYKLSCFSKKEKFASIESLCWEAAESFRFDGPTYSVKARPSAEGSTYHSEEHGYSITFPEGWEVSKGEDPVEVQAMSKEMDNLNVMIIPIVNEAMGDYLRENPRAFVEGIRPDFPDIRIIREEETTLGGQQAYSLLVTLTEGGRRIKAEMVQAQHNEKYFYLVCGAEEDRFARISPLCREAFESFRFDDRSSASNEKMSLSSALPDKTDTGVPYANNNYEYRVTFPKGTKIEEYRDGQEVYGYTEENYAVFIYFVKGKVELSTKLLPGAAEWYLDQMMRDDYPDARIIEKEDASLDGRPAIWFLVEFDADAGDAKKSIRIPSIISVRGKEFPVIQCVMPAVLYDELMPQCQQVFDSFRFEEKAAAKMPVF